MAILNGVEILLHITLFIVAALTIILMGFAYSRFSRGEFKKIIFYYFLAFIFSALRWSGGSFARLDYQFVSTLTFNILWLLAGILSAVFGLYASKLLLDFSRIFAFYRK